MNEFFPKLNFSLLLVYWCMSRSLSQLKSTIHKSKKNSLASLNISSCLSSISSIDLKTQTQFIITKIEAPSDRSSLIDHYDSIILSNIIVIISHHLRELIYELLRLISSFLVTHFPNANH